MLELGLIDESSQIGRVNADGSAEAHVQQMLELRAENGPILMS
jgi:hypothetical protein